MSPLLKYSLARLGLLVVVAGVLLALPVPVSLLVRMMLAFALSLVLSQLLLRRLWNPAAEQVSAAAARRLEEKRRLHAALAGDDQPAEESAPEAEPRPSP